MVSPKALSFWHGSRRWESPPVIRHPRAGRSECGPGLYLTTSIARARSYSKGGGSLVHVELTPSVRWLEDSYFPLSVLESFLDETPRIRGRDSLRRDLRKSATRHPDDKVPATYLLNLMVNSDALVGAPGAALATWLTSHGVDASRIEQSGNESWVVVFNPDVVIRAKKTSSADIDWKNPDFPSLSEQLSLCAPSTSSSAQSVEGESGVAPDVSPSAPRRLRPL